MSHALSIGKELLEIQCSDFTAKEKSSAYQTSDWHPVCMVLSAQQRWQCFYTVTDFKEISEFFRSHEALLFCTFMGFYRYGNTADTFMDLGFTSVFVRTVCTLVSLERHMKLLRFTACISAGFWLVPCRTSYYFGSGLVEYKVCQNIIDWLS